MANEIKLTTPAGGSDAGGDAAAKPVAVKPVLKPTLTASPAGDAPTIKAAAVTLGARKPTATVKAKALKRPIAAPKKPGSVIGKKPGTVVGKKSVVAAAKAKPAEDAADGDGEEKAAPAKTATELKAEKLKAAKAAKGKKPAKAKKPAADDDADMGFETQRPQRAVFATILLVVGFLLSICCVGVMALNMLSPEIAAGLRGSLGRVAVKVDSVPLGPEDHKVVITDVTELLDAAQKRVEASKQMVNQTSNFLQSDSTVAPEAPVITEMPAVADEPMADEPMADEPMADEPMADEPMADEPMADEPMADEPMADEPMADEPVVLEEAPPAEVDVAEVTEAPAFGEEPVAEAPMMLDEPMAEEAPIAVEEPAVEAPVTLDEPVMDAPVLEEEPAADLDLDLEEPSMDLDLDLDVPDLEEPAGIDGGLDDLDDLLSAE